MTVEVPDWHPKTIKKQRRVNAENFSPSLIFYENTPTFPKYIFSHKKRPDTRPDTWSVFTLQSGTPISRVTRSGKVGVKTLRFYEYQFSRRLNAMRKYLSKAHIHSLLSVSLEPC